MARTRGNFLQGVLKRVAILAAGIGAGLILRMVFLPAQPAPAKPVPAAPGDEESPTTPAETDAAALDPLVPPFDLGGDMVVASHSTGHAAIARPGMLAMMTAGGDSDGQHPSLNAALGKGRPFQFSFASKQNHLATHFASTTAAEHHAEPHDAGHHGPQRISTGDFAHGDRAVFEPHGDQVCASGCAASRHPTMPLVNTEFHQLLHEFASQPIDESSPAFEKLLYYGKQTQERLQRYGHGSLDPLRKMALQRELKKTHASVQIRLVDEHGEVRSWLPPTSVPLDRRHVFDMEAKGVQPLVTSGTVKRVGLYHLWTRL